MPKLSFNYNLEKDAWSWVVIAKDKDCWGMDWRSQNAHIPKKLLDQILKLDFPDAQKAVEEYLEKHPNRQYREAIIQQEVIALKNVWSNLEEKFFKKIAEITQKPIYSNNFFGFITTGFMCPYEDKENLFMISFWHSLPSSITTICHELLHFQFLHYYKNYLQQKGLNDAQIEELKESLTFLLNEPEFEDIILVEDNGYPDHRKLREKLRQIWQSEKDFGKFLNKAIEIMNLK